MTNSESGNRPRWITWRARYGGGNFEPGKQYSFALSRSTMRYIMDERPDVVPITGKIDGVAFRYDDAIPFRVVNHVDDAGNEAMSYTVSNPDDSLSDEDVP
jgi:hypothetical protein